MRNEEKLFFVRANGEDLGIMTMRDAFRRSWSQSAGQHVSLSFEPVKDFPRWKPSRSNNGQQRPLTAEQAEEAVKRHNFWRALEMLCAKVGKAKEFHWYIRRRDPDATIGQISDFKRKMVRLLSFNYDVHRRPNPNFNKKLLPSGTPGAEPLSYPPEWRK